LTIDIWETTGKKVERRAGPNRKKGKGKSSRVENKQAPLRERPGEVIQGELGVQGKRNQTRIRERKGQKGKNGRCEHGE